MMNDQCYVHNRSGSGTVTHLAPEALQAGSKLTPTVDVYAFGVLMYELYTGRRAYSNQRREKVIEAVTQLGMRPSFPATVPPAFVRLASACWAAEPEARPEFSEVAAALKRMLDGLRDPANIHNSSSAGPSRTTSGASSKGEAAAGGAGAAAAAGGPAGSKQPRQAPQQEPADGSCEIVDGGSNAGSASTSGPLQAARPLPILSVAVEQQLPLQQQQHPQLVR